MDDIRLQNAFLNLDSLPANNSNPISESTGRNVSFDFDGVPGNILVGKVENLDREAVDRAVRVATEEYEAIAEMKEALIRAGVDVARLELTSRETSRIPRTRVVLVKDLADYVSESELVEIFGAFGDLDKVIRPPTNTFALVMYFNPKHAFLCLTTLKNQPCKDKPLFLEYLAEDILGEVQLSESDLNNVVAVIEYYAKSIPLEHLLDAVAKFDVDPAIIESRTVLVSNLNFYTSDNELRRHFTDHMEEGSVLSARILRSMHCGKRTSCGIAFVELDSENTAVRVCKNLQGSNLGGKALKLSRPNNMESQDTGLDGCCFEALKVVNFAPEATEKDFNDLFGLFGEVVDVDLLNFERALGVEQKPFFETGEQTPFFKARINIAFVRFASEEEALNALAHLRNARLYGYPLNPMRLEDGFFRARCSRLGANE